MICFLFLMFRIIVVYLWLSKYYRASLLGSCVITSIVEHLVSVDILLVNLCFQFAITVSGDKDIQEVQCFMFSSSLVNLIHLKMQLMVSSVLSSWTNLGLWAVKRAVISNETTISSSSVVISLILWRHCSGELMEYLLPSVWGLSFLLDSFTILQVPSNDTIGWKDISGLCFGSLVVQWSKFSIAGKLCSQPGI